MTKSETGVLLVLSKDDYEGKFDDVASRKTRKSGSGSCMFTMEALYSDQLPISSAKKADLMQLCKNGTIPTCYHEFYSHLPSSHGRENRLPVPDELESTDDELAE